MSVSRRMENLPITRFHYLLLLTAGIGWMFDSLDTGIISFVLPVLMKSWHLSTEQVGNIGSIGLLGMAIGAILSGTIADRIGRKKVFALTLVTYSVATGLCGLSWNYASLLVFRFLVGFGLGGQLPVAVTLVSEFSPAKHRGKFLVLLESFWAFGWLSAAIVSYLIIPVYGWPIAFFLGALPALYVFLLWKKVPESPRYLEEKGRATEAEEIYQAIAAQVPEQVNRPRRGQELRQSQEEIKEDLKLRDSNHDSSQIEIFAGKRNSGDPYGNNHQAGATRHETAKAGFWELFAARFLRRTVFLWILWFGIVFSYYGIFTWLPSLLALKGFSLTKSFGYVLIMTIAQIPGYFSAAYLVDRIGRKPTMTVYVLGTAVSAYYFGQGTSAAMILTMGSLMSFFNLGAWGIIYTYTPELYPTYARATGSGWAAGFGRIGGILAPIVVGKMLGELKMTTQDVFVMFTGVLVLVVLVVILLGEETKGRPLDEQ